MHDQHFYKSPAIEVYGHCRLLLPKLRVPCWFFSQSGIENCWHGRPGIEPTTLDINSQSGAYDLSATATPCPGLIFLGVSFRIVFGLHIVYVIKSISISVRVMTTQSNRIQITSLSTIGGVWFDWPWCLNQPFYCENQGSWSFSSCVKQSGFPAPKVLSRTYPFFCSIWTGLDRINPESFPSRLNWRSSFFLSLSQTQTRLTGHHAREESRNPLPFYPLTTQKRWW